MNKSRTALLFISLLISHFMSYSAAATAPVITGERWLDTNGRHINAHGGGIMLYGGVYYWYGEHRGNNQPGRGQKGVACYTSTDLRHWTDRGIVLQVSDTEGSPIEAGCIIERPKVIHNPSTGKFVMWFHNELKGRGYAAAYAGTAIADNPLGPFTLVKSSRVNPGIYPANMTDRQKAMDTGSADTLKWWTPRWREAVSDGLFTLRDLKGGQMARDMTLFVDDDGKAYHIYSSEENLTIQIAELDSTYLNHTGRYIRIFPGGHNEAPALFKHGGRYWMICSGCTGWAPNEARLMRADSIMGQWTQLPNPCIGPGSEITFSGQSTWILPHDGGFTFMADIWTPGNLGASRHLWLPVQFHSDGTPYIENQHRLIKEQPRIEPFPVNAVRLAPSPFMDAMLTDMRYMLELDPDRLLAPYRKGAGLEPKADNYTNWENTGLDGHIGGHYLSALSHMYAATWDTAIWNRLDYFMNELMDCQEAAADGYLCGVPDGRRIWSEISNGNIRADGFSLNGGWVPLYNIHKIYAGLRDAYLLTGDQRALTMLIRLSDWMIQTTSALTDSQIQEMLRSEHGGLNEVFADVAAITGDRKYLDLAIRFSHRAILNPIMAGQDRLTGMHANTQIPKIIGFKRIADLSADTIMNRAAQSFWNTVVNNRSITIGGNSVCEHFHPADDFSSMTESEQGPETCNTYNMLRLSKMLYGTSADTRYMDYYERALYNHILSSQNPDRGGFVYFTPMRPGHYRVYSKPQEGFWCCVGSGLENHARYGEMIYGHSADTLYVNLFIPSDLNWDGTTVSQRNDFPDEESTTLTIMPGKRHRTFTLKVRTPQWTDTAGMTISVNGTPQPVEIHNGFLSIRRRWRDNDVVKLTLPMSLQAVGMPDGSPHTSFMYGPIVLASRMGTDDLTGLYADDSRGGHIASSPKMPMRQIPAIIGSRDSLTSHITKVPGRPLRFTLHGLSSPEHEGMILGPFYRIHNSRYMIYWPVHSSGEWDAIRLQTEAEDRQRTALDAITADMVVCGEQQPESDHFISADDSRTGDDNGRHWREAKGSFSYIMRNNDGNINEIRLKFTPRASRMASVAAGDSVIGIIDGNDTTGTVRLTVPESMRACSTLKVTISSLDGKTTPRIHEVRALTADLPSGRLVKVSGNGYGRTSVNTAIFRANSLATHGNRQYTAYYDADGYLTLGARPLDSDRWTIRRTRYKGNAADAHNVISITVDGDGYLHVAFDHHSHKLKYCRSTGPGSLRLGPLEPMTGSDEDDVTYPEFHTLNDGSILFAYRSGASGRGNLVLNRYDTATRRWNRLHSILIDGEDRRNAYWQLHVDNSGTIHLSWVWRESWLVETNHDLCYARSRDNGLTWEHSDGTPYTLPITASNAEYAMRIPQNSELINQTSMSADSQGNPYIATYWRDPDSAVPQYRMVWHDGRQWNSRQVGHRITPFTLSGGGTKMIPISRPRMVLDGDRVLYLFRDAERHNRISMACTSTETASGEWTIIPLTDFAVNAWEPTFDAELWRAQQKLHIFVQPSLQGDGERAVDTAPQPVYVLEIDR